MPRFSTASDELSPHGRHTLAPVHLYPPVARPPSASGRAGVHNPPSSTENIGLGIFVDDGPAHLPNSPRSPFAPPARPHLGPNMALATPPTTLRPLASPLSLARTPESRFQLPGVSEFVEQRPPYPTPHMMLMTSVLEGDGSDCASESTPRTQATYGGSDVAELTATLAGLSHEDPFVSGRFLNRALTPDEVDRNAFGEFSLRLRNWLDGFRPLDPHFSLSAAIEAPLMQIAHQSSERATRLLNIVTAFVEDQLPPPWMVCADRLESIAAQVGGWLPHLQNASRQRLELIGNIAPKLYQAGYRLAWAASRHQPSPEGCAHQAAGAQWHAFALAMVSLSDAAVDEIQHLFEEAHQRPNLQDQLMYSDTQTSNFWQLGHVAICAQRVAPASQAHMLEYVRMALSDGAFVPFEMLGLIQRAELCSMSYMSS